MIYKILCLAIITLTACDDSNPTDYEHQLFPVVKGEFEYSEENIFEDIPVALKIESRIFFEDRAIEGQFEHINIEDLIITSDREMNYGNTTFESSSNLNGTPFINIELVEQERSGGWIPDFYIIWIDKNLDSEFANNIGYYSFYIKADTENNYEISDSTFVKIE